MWKWITKQEYCLAEVVLLIAIVCMIHNYRYVCVRDTEINTHHCPRPSVEQVQSDLNDMGENLDIDGVAGHRTVEAWMYYSPTWEADNERYLIGD